MPLPTTPTKDGIGVDGDSGHLVFETESDALSPEEYREFVATAIATVNKGMNDQDKEA